MDLLVFLASRHGQVVTKEEILDVVWSTRIVAESALSSAVAEMRQVLQDDPRRPWLVETIPKRGYRFLVRPLPCSLPVGGGGPASCSEPPWPEGPEAVFVGRTAELRTLDHALAEARSGRGRVVFVAGEAGSGKTALLAEPEVAGGRCPDTLRQRARCSSSWDRRCGPSRRERRWYSSSTTCTGPSRAPSPSFSTSPVTCRTAGSSSSLRFDPRRSPA